MTAKKPRPLTQPRKGEPNHGKFCNAPGSLPPESNLPMQPSLAEQLEIGNPPTKSCFASAPYPVSEPSAPFDHKACILCDHVIVQKILGNKCGMSGSLCCNLKECPIEARNRREASRPVLPDKTCDPSCPNRSPVCEETCPEYQFKERFASWLAVNYPALDIKSHQDIVDNASVLFDEFWADRS